MKATSDSFSNHQNITRVPVPRTGMFGCGSRSDSSQTAIRMQVVMIAERASRTLDALLPRNARHSRATSKIGSLPACASDTSRDLSQFRAMRERQAALPPFSGDSSEKYCASRFSRP